MSRLTNVTLCSLRIQLDRNHRSNGSENTVGLTPKRMAEVNIQQWTTTQHSESHNKAKPFLCLFFFTDYFKHTNHDKNWNIKRIDKILLLVIRY